MKKLFLILVLLFSVNTQADEACEGLSYLAEVVMTQRQANRDVSELYSIAKAEPDISEIAIALIIDAYDSPLYSTESNKQRAIREFKNDIFILCLNNSR